ncbi:hypothetical protein ACFS2C_08850 [Prauserella oleivorans]|uniref:Uncharacterized protein n=1 Tax=Prauserella oleivorans TaxID=1478153 RepID=A0ABW5W8J3_9PSEU
MALPKDVRDRVIRRIYADMRAIDWDELSPRERTRQYDLWVNDPEIGGVIANFNDDPRHWIKDGPVKEWPRAKIGHGSHARLLGEDHDPAAERRRLAEKIVRLTLPEWVPDPDSITEKPMRMVVHPPKHEEAEPRIVTWGNSDNFKHLLWAALEAVESDDHRSWVLAVTETFEKPVSADMKALHRRIARRCKLQVEHIEL